MISERLILDGESVNQGQKATGQNNHCRACFRLYNRVYGCSHAKDAQIYSMIKYFEDNPEQMDDTAGRRMYERYLQKAHMADVHVKMLVEVNKPRVKKHAGHELGAREFTLTYSPQWCDDATARELMIRAVERIMKYYRNEICELEVVGEITKSGQSHIHGYYLLDGGRKITDKNFKRAYKFWNPKKKLGRGHEGGHHEVVKAESDFKGYIDKDRLDAWYEFSYLREEHNNASGPEEDSEENAESDASAGVKKAPKAYATNKGVSVALPATVSAVPLATIPQVKKLIAGKAENKLCGIVHQAQYNAFIDSAADAYPLLPVVPAGTGDNQRIGNRITPKGLRVSVSVL